MDCFGGSIEYFFSEIITAEAVEALFGSIQIVPVS